MNHNLAKQIEQRSVEELIPYARNARTHSEAQVTQLARSIEQFGFTNPVLIDAANSIIAGHGRVMAAKQLGMVTVPCLRVDWLTEAQQRAYVLADNQLALQAGWDEDLLALELRDLQDIDFDLGLIGFADNELSAILAGMDATKEGETDEDAVPETSPGVEPVSRPGDIWRMGLHRIMCGDSTSVADVERLLAGAKPHLMVTDPPYGVEYDPGWRNEAEQASGGKVGGARATGVVLNDDRADWREAWALFPGEVAYVWHAGIFSGDVKASLEACKFEIRCQIIWAKPRFAISRGHYHWQHEPCWYAVRKGGGRALAGRPFPNHSLADHTQQIRNRPRHTKTRRGHAAPHREQLPGRRINLRTVQRIWHHSHRVRKSGTALLRHGVKPRLCRYRRPPLATIHRQTRHTRIDRRTVPRGMR